MRVLIFLEWVQVTVVMFFRALVFYGVGFLSDCIDLEKIYFKCSLKNVSNLSKGIISILSYSVLFALPVSFLLFVGKPLMLVKLLPLVLIIFHFISVLDYKTKIKTKFVVRLKLFCCEGQKKPIFGAVISFCKCLFIKAFTLFEYGFRKCH